MFSSGELIKEMGTDVSCLRGLNSEKEQEVFNGFRNEEVTGVLVESSVDDVGWIWGV